MEDHHMSQSKMDRRQFFGVSAAGLTILGVGRAVDTKPGAVVETTSGKIRGLVIDKVNAFKGVPYGTAKRFMPAAKPAWTGVRDTMAWGHEAPQGPHTEIPEVASTIPKTVVGEDCQVLNVWTNSLTGKRPVMVWLHGGGFTSGNGCYTMYDGANLARRRDVVAVTLNHRLNAFGYMYLGGIGGEKYETSGNLGMMDIVLALQWVRDNISKFGGDPNNVMIYGQSGGAGKVSTLLAMPPAKGLFHRAGIQSGAALRGQSIEAANRSARAFMDKLGAKTVDELAAMPMEKLIAAAITPGGGVNFSPVLDGKTLIDGPFDPAAPAMSADIPVLIGTVEYEVGFFPFTKFDPMDDAALHASVKQTLRLSADSGDGDADRVIAAYKKGRPGLTNLDYNLILASDNFRNGAVIEAERKAAQKAPVYMYYFTWQSPVRDGKLKAYHTLEIPFHQENVDEAKGMTGEGRDRYALQDKMSMAWSNFARTGNPNHKGLPAWPAFDTTKRATMILNNEPRVVNDPNGEERKLVNSLRQS
jgi:para-nitrobenzyl esterase